MKPVALLLVISALISCDRHFYNGNVVVQAHAWVLMKIDTLYSGGKYKPGATWYNKHDKLNYVDHDHEFPYPYNVGDKIFNFDKK